MSIHAAFSLNGQDPSMLDVPAIGSLPAFSGSGRWRNKPEGVGVAEIGPLPQGRYYIVDRQSGAKLGWIRDFLQDQWSGVDRSHWFALLRDDGRIDDETFVERVRRGEFRLHPVGPLGISKGCVTLQRRADFDRLAAALRDQRRAPIPRHGGLSYGTVTVS